MKRNLDTKENKDYWNFVKKTAKEVEKWPDWMKKDDTLNNPPIDVYVPPGWQ